MVKDNLDKTKQQSPKQNRTAEPQSQGQHREQHAATEQNTVRAESQEPAERQLDSLIWMKLSLEEQAESWHQVSTR